MPPRRAVVLLLLVCLLGCWCAPIDAFLSQLLSLGFDHTRAGGPDVREIALARPAEGGGPSNGHNGHAPPRSSFHLPSLAALHANLKEMVSRGAIVPARCRAASAEAQIWARCAHLTQADKTYLAVAFTECHFDLYTHKYKNEQDTKSCQEIEDATEMAECVKDMNTGDVFPIFIQFKTTLETLCQQVDHDFARRRSHAAMDQLMDATLHTARSLSELQVGTEELTKDLHGRMERSSSAVMDLLSTHTAAEADRFQALSAAARNLEAGQEGLMDQLTSQTTHLRDLLSDSQSIQRLINATTVDIAATQVDILAMQTETSSTLTHTQQDLISLKVSQQQHFEEALQSLHSLRSLSDALAEAQASSSQAVEQLARDQDLAFARAASALSTLHEDQVKAFESGARQLADIRNLQGDINVAQTSLLDSVRHSSDEMRNLASTQRENFAQTGLSLERIQQQAAEVENKLGTMLLELKAALSQLLNLNLDMLRELFQIHSALFYVALAPLAYFATATERTKSARFWIFLLLLTTLLVELNLVSAVHRFRIQLSQPEFDALRARLRYALSVLSSLVLVLTALLHRDYTALNFAQNERNGTVINNNHRMLHELLRRTEHLSTSPGTSPRSYTATRNPFQQGASPPRVNPAGEGHVAPAVSVSTDTGDSMPELEQWHQVCVDGPTACCVDQRTPRSLMARMFGSGDAASVSSNTPNTPQVKREVSFISDTLWSPAPAPPRTHSTSHSTRSTEGEAEYEEEETVPDESEDEHTAPSRLRRSSRSRSRSVARDTTLTVPSASKPRKRTPTKRTVKEEVEGEADEGDASQPGAEQDASNRRRRSRT